MTELEEYLFNKATTTYAKDKAVEITSLNSKTPVIDYLDKNGTTKCLEGE